MTNQSVYYTRWLSLRVAFRLNKYHFCVLTCHTHTNIRRRLCEIELYTLLFWVTKTLNWILRYFTKLIWGGERGDGWTLLIPLRLFGDPQQALHRTNHFVCHGIWHWFRWDFVFISSSDPQRNWFHCNIWRGKNYSSTSALSLRSREKGARGEHTTNERTNCALDNLSIQHIFSMWIDVFYACNAAGQSTHGLAWSYGANYIRFSIEHRTLLQFGMNKSTQITSPTCRHGCCTCLFHLFISDTHIGQCIKSTETRESQWDKAICRQRRKKRKIFHSN